MAAAVKTVNNWKHSATVQLLVNSIDQARNDQALSDVRQPREVLAALAGRLGNETGTIANISAACLVAFAVLPATFRGLNYCMFDLASHIQ